MQHSSIFYISGIESVVRQKEFLYGTVQKTLEVNVKVLFHH